MNEEFKKKIYAVLDAQTKTASQLLDAGIDGTFYIKGTLLYIAGLVVQLEKDEVFFEELCRRAWEYAQMILNEKEVK